MNILRTLHTLGTINILMTLNTLSLLNILRILHPLNTKNILNTPHTLSPKNVLSTLHTLNTLKTLEMYRHISKREQDYLETAPVDAILNISVPLHTFYQIWWRLILSHYYVPFLVIQEPFPQRNFPDFVLLYPISKHIIASQTSVA
jgi:hypothetical protein